MDDTIKKLTLLHTNDLHGDFLPKIRDGKEVGGLARLSGYVNKIRKEKKNVIYAMAGDMFRGSVIDSEYHGLSTINLMNNLRPDVATIGNHEVDYGFAHLLFLEKCAKFPIVNANLFITLNNSRVFTPYINIDIDGMRIMFIGLLTEEVLSSTKCENIIGTFIDLEAAAKEVGIICDNYRTVRTDMTILLTHIGFENDVKLAQMLDPDWGVDLIIGGHSHTFMDKPEVVNGVPIVQAGSGSGVIGRFDIQYDQASKKIEDLRWKCVPINEDTAPVDTIMEELIDSYRTETDRKYKRVVTRWARKLTHPCREQETEMGNLYADVLADGSSFEIMLFGSGSIRKTELGPVIEYQDMIENTPFEDVIYMIEVTGAQWRRMVQYLMRDEAWLGETEFYQFSKGVKIVYRKSTHTIEELSFKGTPVTDDMHLKLGLQAYHFKNFDKFFGVPLEEVKRNMKPRVCASSQNNIIEEYFCTNDGLDAQVEGRITILD
ncbi:MAG: bifunctional UDP-sugar hydrolase/5'-nucleotidase [Lachnospiraceae bacterium]|jgi:5'-nucleotidase|nr:bifunctional metallophosphatase/5'-nucleotidase [Lachnospiraceae bacterium]MEE3377370.1 bifunctional UDP-sugar hydrolase/5'-nucleotidase [Lachnospiraceae bacterium]MEE3436716.1 bifunctional UDP-sugar hydrolase/5'-nucleotidase [Lachnospiraceae bacterium]MEE3456718.1 bifunctional UDP-sugar hydrolase/5'-nucleotidase [Lachnospiraceae bacterium]